MRILGRWGHRRAKTGVADGATPTSDRRTEADEDARILRRTRLRLMAWSSGVTLLILVVLGVAVYVLVSSAVDAGARDQLQRAATHSNSDEPYGFTPEGDTAGLLPIRISPSGVVQVPPGLSRIPPGLPNKASLGAVTAPGQIDIRNVTATDGTPYRVLSGFVLDPRLPDYKVQWAQNRANEVAFLNTLTLTLVGGGAVALLVSLLFGYLYAGRALVPIRLSIVRRQAALQRQREFTANASHELRTPLTVIRASVEDLRRNRRRRVEEVGEALTDIEAEARHVTALVDDMLLLARTDSRVVQIERVPLDLADVAVEAASTLAGLGQERGVTVMADPLPAPMTGDPLRLRQLVTILVDNAVRHSPADSTVAVRVRPESGAATLQVEDRGQGIKPDDLPRIFERFWRADDAPAGGTGLGLAIAKWIVEQHGGTIGVENRAEGGARFWVRLPAEFAGTAAASAALASAALASAATDDGAAPPTTPSS